MSFFKSLKKPTSAHESAVARYFAALEPELKRRPGVVPEEGLDDARRYLERELTAVDRELDDEEIAARLVTGFGAPAEVADTYASRVEDVKVRPGYAPGWRVFCPGVGEAPRRPAWAYSAWGPGHGVSACWAHCRKCGRLRRLCLVKDLDKPTLTKASALRLAETGETDGPLP